MLTFKEYFQLHELDANGMINILNSISSNPKIFQVAVDPTKNAAIKDTLAAVGNRTPQQIAQLTRVVANAAKNPQNKQLFANAKSPSEILNQVTNKLAGNTQQVQKFLTNLPPASLEMLKQSLDTKNFNLFLKTLNPAQQKEFFSLSLMFKNSPEQAKKAVDTTLQQKNKQAPAQPNAQQPQQVAGKKPVAPAPAAAKPVAGKPAGPQAAQPVATK